ncbi:MAG: hypothetical protein AMS18_15495 [Gemmatimonas sp. SG8_17]|nr:MAG: hypothetical protein AMS18_15495 [Gemmatimonas sp. SG8_17]
MINEKALELGRLIGQTEDHKALQRAREALDEASEVRAQMQRIEVLSERIEQQVREQKDPPKELTDEYEQLLASIQAHPRYQQVVAAQANFEKLMLKVNEHIVQGMKQGAESPIIIPG